MRNVVARDRIEGLDVWRALLVAGGLFVHASFQLERVPLFAVVEGASQAFRMGAFFAISGLLSAIAIERADPVPWLGRRVIQLGVPAMVGLATISPLIWWLVVTAPQHRPGGPPLRYEWHHLWFLFALILYSCVAVLVDRIDRRWGLASRIDTAAGSPRSARIAILTVAACGAVLIGAAPPLMRAVMPPWSIGPFANLQMIAGYLPMFLLGLALGRSARLRSRCVEASGFAAVLVVVATAVFALTHAHPALARWQEEARFVAVALCPPAAFVLILRSALSIRRVPVAIRHVSDASYTIYVLHLPIAVAFNTRLGDSVDPHIGYLGCVVIAGLASYFIHAAVVARCPPISLLVNGRLPRRRPDQDGSTVCPT